MDIATVLIRKFPNTQWNLVNNDYTKLEWFAETPKPSKKTLEGLWAEVQAEVARESVERSRQVAYRNESDPVFFEYQRGDKTQQEWLDAVQAVKDAHPYPDTP